MEERLYATSKIMERFVLIAADTENSQAKVQSSLKELGELVKTLGGEVAGVLTQNMENIHPGHYLGIGKLEEVKMLAAATNATGVIADDELSPAQYKNMERILETKIIDRTALILDIFAMNAKSAEGKAQVELAQLNYRLSRLAGLGKSLSRLGGGIGTRGPGEKKLETDRRHVRNRITQLNRELKEIETRRDVLRGKRERNGIPVVSLVGYTNAGKSTIMNLLSKSDVLAEDKLFATLDTTTRNVTIAGFGEFLLTDTVGFIQKLPHQLIKAFRATLSELSYADILIHVVDSANEDFTSHMDVVYKTLASLGVIGKPVITAYNKMDLAANIETPLDKNASQVVRLSAKTGDGSERLTEAIENELKKLKREVTVLLPYSEGSLLSLIHKSGEVLSASHEENGTRISAYVPPELEKRVEEYVLRD
ncbi:MAG: GTPase HflX [Clostridiales bacterium]|jgi:GTP-binding protein HflX|nr:GTPase HflX [Clostridiales bacterium]